MIEWLSRWLKSLSRDQLDTSVEVRLETEEAKKALEDSLLALQKIDQQELEAKAISFSLRRRREQNHFGELLLFAMRRKTPR